MPLKPIYILGIGADGPTGLPLRSRSILADAQFIAGGNRHLALLGPSQADTFAITNNLPALVERLSRRREDERCVVLASGDPLFFGVAAYLRKSLPTTS